MIDFKLQRYALFALFAAALFGASTPLAKLLLDSVSPTTLAGLLYLGSGIGLLAIRIGKAWFTGETSNEAQLKRSDYPWLVGAVLTGGVVAPVMLMWGLSGITASAASLLLNFESVITTLVAALVFHEAVGRRIWVASIVMLCGGLLLSYDPRAYFSLSVNSIAVTGACLMWAIDNNLTRKISATDPTTIAMIKGLVAGTVTVSLGRLSGDIVPATSNVAGAMILGLFSYGISLVLFIYALRHLGSARTGAHFSTAPFIGAGVAILVLGEPLTMSFAIALILMALATWLALTEQHGHEHTHEYMVHTHRHYHDEHHRHEHDGTEDPEPHAHAHVHLPMTHRHPHLPDIHHRHEH
ncbi:MAG: DMT family transporter [Betaproteobacteria bacterium]|nr:DMT family transporter [Betaproteobacteria bacterium]